ncbi:serine--tRNA ligase [SAR202 cluster bacterium AC-409-J13_OGT_754m]|nr:serine--tRNA ligase [SAR202 cluster bacterium AC-409-J13_OGT_754m]
MLSIEMIRHDPDYVLQALELRGETPPITQILSIDEKRRSFIAQGDILKAKRNQVSKDIGQSKGAKQQLVEEMRKVGEEISTIDQEVKLIQEELNSLLLGLPNLPKSAVPEGLDESSNVIVKTWGDPKSFTFAPLPHWELAEKLGILDLQRGANISGSRFFVLVGKGAKLERALTNFMLEIHTSQHDYCEVQVPTLVRREIMLGSGNLPKFGDNLYHDEEDDLWLIPTSEVPLTGMHNGEILQPGVLPLKYVALTPCFRREKTAAGRDTRGIKRVHQFNKVEMYKFCIPETSENELITLVENAETICKLLELPYRVQKLCTGELGFSSSMSYDLEMWAPGCEEWLEVSSCSNCTDFQARRSNIRYRSKQGGPTAFVHTLNGSGLALPRVLISLLENGQQEDGSVIIPEALRPYTGFDIIDLP